MGQVRGLIFSSGSITTGVMEPDASPLPSPDNPPAKPVKMKKKNLAKAPVLTGTPTLTVVLLI